MAAPGARGRAWRSAFASLRDASSPQNLLQQVPSLIRSAQELPSQEVAEDITNLLKFSSHGSSDSLFKFCRLVAEVTCAMQLDFGTTSSCHLSKFLREIIDQGAFESYVNEAVNAFAYFVNANGQHLSPEEANAVLLSLARFMVHNDNSRKETKNKRATGADVVFIAISNTFTRAGSLVTQSTWNAVVQAFRKLLDRAAHPLEDAATSKYYATMLRCLHIVLSDAKGPLDENVAGLVASLRLFFGYGLQSNRLRSSSETPTSSGAPKEVNKGSSLYRPPHLRARNSEAGGSTSDEKDRRAFFSDSEHSDSDGFENDPSKSSKVRTNAILSIQAIARADPKSLHAHWSLLLPSHNVLLPRPYQPTLMTTLLFDPALKTRVAAASAVSALLEGPARAFLQVAEYKDSGKTGSYTTLSSSLGQIIVELHKGLLHSVTNESHTGVLLAVFKSLSLLASSSPFERLPSQLLCDVLKSVHRKVCEQPSALDPLVTVAGLSCMSSALSASTGSSEVSSLLAGNLSESSRNSIISSLVSFARTSYSSPVRVEALQGLRAAIHAHSSLASLHWKLISELVKEIIEQENSSQTGEARNCVPARVTDDKIVFHALKLLDEALRAISGFKGAEDLFEAPASSPSPSSLPQPTKLLASSDERKAQAIDELHLCSPAQAHWLQTLREFLPQTLHHPGPLVRAAALTCFAGMTMSLYSDLTHDDQANILSTVIDAAVKDGTPSVRSAACRALGVVISCENLSERNDRLRSAIATVQATISDASLSVRITSCWALANICDILCRTTGKLSPAVAYDVDCVNTLADIALKAAKDSDKVRANAVRALGNLAKFVNFSGSDKASPSSWLSRMVQTLVSCITTGNVKVQWNVCHALGNLFLNKSIDLATMPWSSSVYSILLLLLRDSGNFKIRIHTAAALAVPSSRADFGESFGDVLHGLIHALESLETERAPSSFKYISTLSEQLTSTSLRVLSFAEPDDYITLKDFLHKRASFLYRWLESLLNSSTVYGEATQTRFEAAAGAVEIMCSLLERGREAPLLDRFQKLKSKN